MLQAQILSLTLLAAPGLETPQQALERAASAYAFAGWQGARQQLARHGFFPFALRLSRSAERSRAQGMTHCAPIPSGGELLCARLVARLIDRSPVHGQVAPLAGYRLLAGHVVRADGGTERLQPDSAGIFDWPSADRGVAALGISVRGAAGPETGLFIQLSPFVARRDSCREGSGLSGLVAAINRSRSRLGHPALIVAQTPPAYAAQRRDELGAAFGHAPSGLGASLRRHRLRLAHAAEVVAEDASLAAVCRGWMMSPAHRAALLDQRRNVIAFVRRGERVAALLWRRDADDVIN
jgi:hypothetical protein